MQGGRVFIFPFYQGPNLLSGALTWGKNFFFFRGCLACLLGSWGLTPLWLLLSFTCIHSANPVHVLSSVPGGSGEPDAVPACDELPWGMAAG